MASRQDVFSKPEEMTFVAGYLFSLMWDTLNKRGCTDVALIFKMLKYVCDGVIPGRLWDIVERGESLGNSFLDDSSPEYMSAKDAYELGKECGIYDASKLDWEGVAPENLQRYLVGEDVVTGI